MSDNEQDTDRTLDVQTSDESAVKQFLTFHVGKEEYGIELMTIREIKGWQPTTSLPDSPDFMKGVINIRGVIIPIFDLRFRFGLETQEPTEKNVVIIILVGEKMIGILVDAVSDILNIPSEQIKPAPQIDSKIDEKFISGLIAVEGNMVAILDIDHLFDIDSIEKIESSTVVDEISEEQE